MYPSKIRSSLVSCYNLLAYSKLIVNSPRNSKRFFVSSSTGGKNYSLISNTLAKLEWVLNSPPKPHAFVSLPKQSFLNISNILKKITLSKVISITITVIGMAILRYLYFWGLVSNPLDIAECIRWAWSAGIFKLIIESVLSELFIKMGGDHSLEDYLNKGISLIHQAEDKTPGIPSNTGGGKGASSQSNAGSSSKAGSSTNAGDSTDALKGKALILKSFDYNNDLDLNSLIIDYNTNPSNIETAKQRFPLKNPNDVPEGVALYTSWYNIKCKTLIELTVLKDPSIKSDSVVTSRITKLNKMSENSSKNMDKIENALKRSDKRFISNNLKKKPW